MVRYRHIELRGLQEVNTHARDDTLGAARRMGLDAPAWRRHDLADFSAGHGLGYRHRHSGRQHQDLGAQAPGPAGRHLRSEEHTSELQSLMRISYAVFCLTKKKSKITSQVRPLIRLHQRI